MCFPLFKKVNGKWQLYAVYTDFDKLVQDCKSNNYTFPDFCWEPWPVNTPWEEE